MTDDEFLRTVTDRMAWLRVRQEDVAAACGCSQGHLSKVLTKKVKLAPKTEAALRNWLASLSDENNANNAQEVRDLVDRLLQGPSARRMQIMQLLRLINGIAQ